MTGGWEKLLGWEGVVACGLEVSFDMKSNVAGGLVNSPSPGD